MKSRLPVYATILLSGAMAAAETAESLIDRHIWQKLAADKVPHAAMSGDAEFVRRIHLDLTGRLPTPAEAKAFLDDKRQDKRNRLIDSLFPEIPKPGLRSDFRKPLIDRWTYFFSDLFKNGQLLEEGINVFREYLYKSLVLNIPYDEFAREMLTTSTVSTWTHGAANMIARWHVFEFDGYMINHEDTCDEIGINTGKVFLGVNLECVSCHDGKGHLEKVNLWLAGKKRAEFWRQSAFFGKTLITPAFGREPEFIVRDSASGYDLKTKSALRPPRYAADLSPTFILDGQTPLPGENPRQAYARILTSHPQFARATVNLFWAELMGEGIVDPPLEFDLARQDPANPPPAPWTIQPSHPALLNELAEAFQKSGYDLRWLLKSITRSKTYQLSATFSGKWEPRYDRHFARRKLRRLSAQQMWDGVADVTGIYREIPVRYDDAKVKTILETRSPMDMDRGGHKDLNELAAEFGQCDRYTREASRDLEMSQAAVLLNHKALLDWLKVREGGRLHALLNGKPPAAPEKTVDELYLAALSRRPSAEELRVAGEYITAHGPEGVEDFAWSLVNNLEFLFY